MKATCVKCDKVGNDEEMLITDVGAIHYSCEADAEFDADRRREWDESQSGDQQLDD